MVLNVKFDIDIYCTCTDTIRRKPYSSPNTVIRHTTYLLYSLCRTILQKKLKEAESRADLVRELRGLIERSQGLSCDDLTDEYLLEILDWAARDRIDKIAGWLVWEYNQLKGEIYIIGCVISDTKISTPFPVLILPNHPPQISCPRSTRSSGPHPKTSLPSTCWTPRFCRILRPFSKVVIV